MNTIEDASTQATSTMRRRRGDVSRPSSSLALMPRLHGSSKGCATVSPRGALISAEPSPVRAVYRAHKRQCTLIRCGSKCQLRTFERHLKATIDSRDLLRPAATGPLGSQLEPFSP